MENKKALEAESKGYGRFISLTADPKKLKKINKLISKIGKSEVEFLLRNLRLNPTLVQRAVHNV